MEAPQPASGCSAVGKQGQRPADTYMQLLLRYKKTQPAGRLPGRNSEGRIGPTTLDTARSGCIGATVQPFWGIMYSMLLTSVAMYGRGGESTCIQPSTYAHAQVLASRVARDSMYLEGHVLHRAWDRPPPHVDLRASMQPAPRLNQDSYIMRIHVRSLTGSGEYAQSPSSASEGSIRRRRDVDRRRQVSFSCLRFDWAL